MTDYEREEMYDKVSDVLSDFCEECLGCDEYLEGTYREDLEMNLCDTCYEYMLEDVI